MNLRTAAASLRREGAGDGLDSAGAGSAGKVQIRYSASGQRMTFTDVRLD